ncbi:hypothetical protein D3C81_1185460 [compost metagenome]
MLIGNDASFTEMAHRNLANSRLPCTRLSNDERRGWLTAHLSGFYATINAIKRLGVLRVADNALCELRKFVGDSFGHGFFLGS